MAKISIVEREYIERVLGMKGGHILDFTNRTFQEIVHQVIDIDVYQKYEYESKAKLLRRVFNDFENKLVGKLLLELLRYRKEHLEIKQEEKKEFNKALELAYKLLGRKPKKKTSKVAENNELKSFDFGKAKKQFYKVLNIVDPHKRGFAFEKMLYEFFDDNDLNPRASFKIIGEQIDGSFDFENEIYLLEAKWTYEKTSKADLVVFNEKVSSKSNYTRGVFISFSGYSETAVQTFNDGRTVRVVLITVQELVIAIERNISFRDVLKFKVRGLAEEGNCFKSTISL